MIIKRSFLSSILLGLVVANAQVCAESKPASGAPVARVRKEQSIFDKENWWKWALGAGTLLAAYYCLSSGSSSSVTSGLSSAVSGHKALSKNGIKIELGDIAAPHGDPSKKGVVVNAANKDLTYTCTGGGDVAKAIRMAAGNQLAQDKNIAGKYLKPGQTTTTPGYGLTKSGYSHIVHAVGPDCRIANEGNNRQQLLRAAYTNSLSAAANVGAQKVVLPALSTGNFGYADKDEVAGIAVTCAQEALRKKNSIQEIVFALFKKDATYHAFVKALGRI